MTLHTAAQAAVQREIDRAIEERREIGVQVAAYLDGELVIDAWGGQADETTGRGVDGDTLFNVFSVSKAIAVTALHLQVERALIEYEAPVARYWPEFAVNGKEAITVRHVITHCSGAPQMPADTTPELMADWDAMVRRLAELEPLAAPGSRPLYQALNHGWLVGELIRRTDPKGRTPGAFVREELGGSLGAPDLWFGLPDALRHRVAKLTDASNRGARALPPLYLAAMPPPVDLVPAVYELPSVRRSEILAVGGVFSARSCARVWAMLAQGGELDGMRLLSKTLVSTFNTPRNGNDEPDRVMYGRPMALSIAGYWLGGDQPPVACAAHRRAICHPGAGNSFAWADPEQRLAVAFCHNRMAAPANRDEDNFLPIANAIRYELGLS